MARYFLNALSFCKLFVVDFTDCGYIVCSGFQPDDSVNQPPLEFVAFRLNGKKNESADTILC